MGAKQGTHRERKPFNMKKVIQASGKTRALAVAEAVRQLGCSEDDVSVFVLQNESKGFLGIGAKPCIVRVTWETEEADTVAPVVHQAPMEKKKEVSQERPAPVKAERPVQTEKVQPQPVQPAPKPVEQEKVQQAEMPAACVEAGEKENEARKFLADVLEKMNVQAEIAITSQKDEMRIEFSGPDMGIIIGRRGETLDALQYLTSLVVNKGEEGYIKVTLDTENYRKKREDTLVKLATKLAGKVVKYRRNISLEPMNPYERRIIHSALQDYEGVTTYSTGSEPNRKVVIASTEPGRPPREEGERRGKGSRYGKRSGKYHDRNDRRRSYRDTVEGEGEPISTSDFVPTAVPGEKLARAAKVQLPVEEQTEE